MSTTVVLVKLPIQVPELFGLGQITVLHQLKELGAFPGQKSGHAVNRALAAQHVPAISGTDSSARPSYVRI